jgi:site-specific recombinase XerD
MTGNISYPTDGPSLDGSLGNTSQAETVALVAQWLHGRPATTVRKYRAVLAAFLAECPDPAEISVADVTGYLDRRPHLAPSSRNAHLAAIKSYLRYAHQAGAIARDVGRLVKAERQRDRLAERILTREQVKRLIDGEEDPARRLILRTLYIAGLRVAELCGLAWRDVQGDVFAIYGKGGKTRYVRVGMELVSELRSMSSMTGSDESIFAISPRTVERIVKEAAIRVGLPAGVSPHWLRHCHASHALDAGAPIHLVRDTLGHSDIKTTSRYLHSQPTDSSARYLG